MENKNADRRDFLKTAGAAFTTSIFTGRLRGANDRPTAGFIGIGVMGSENLGVALKHGVEVKAFCDVYQPHLERAGAIVARAGQKAKEVKDFREILADKSIDLVCISTPDHWHPYITVEACKAGKDVYVEKPVSHNVWEGRQLVNAAKKYNKVVQAGTQIRSGAGLREAVQWVQAGNLGTITPSRGFCYKRRDSSGLTSGATHTPATPNNALSTGPAAPGAVTGTKSSTATPRATAGAVRETSAARRRRPSPGTGTRSRSTSRFRRWRWSRSVRSPEPVVSVLL